MAAVLLILAKILITDNRLYAAPEGTGPPPFWIRGLLVLTCTAVGFAHGSNDGQKGMGLIMLILIGLVPTAYALNRAVPASATMDFVAVSADGFWTSTRPAARSSAIRATSCKNTSGARDSLPTRCRRFARSSTTLRTN